MKKKYSIAKAQRNLPAIVHEAERMGAVRITRRGQVVARLLAGDLGEARYRIHARIAGCQFGPAAQARPVAVRLRGRRAGEEAAVLALGRLDGADRAAINARRRDRDEKAAVKPGVTRSERPVTDAGVENHERIMGAAAGLVWPFSDIAARRRARRQIKTDPFQAM